MLQQLAKIVGPRYNQSVNTQEMIARVMRRVRPDGNCWIWTGATWGGKNHNAYGHIRYLGKQWTVHRFMYEATHGPISEGLEVDHICRRKLCVNPVHLEAVTGKENIRRAWENLSHCPNGHPYTPENLLHKCRICHSTQQKARRTRLRNQMSGLQPPST